MIMLCVVALLAGAGAAAAGDESVGNPVELQPLQALTATHERPLFSPTRRSAPKIVTPVAAVKQEPPPAPPPPPSLVLLGIVSENGEARAAVRAGDKRPADKVLRVRAGDDVGGWKVDRIESRRLVLTQGERSADFVLFAVASKTVKSADAAARGRGDR
jgi:general secretion pathway protein N